jgi:hypothetical protein
MKVYLYKNSLYCPKCADDIKFSIVRERREGKINQYTLPQETSIVSSDLPKYCHAGDACLDAKVWRSGFKTGRFLENALTDLGIETIAKIVEDEPNSELAEFYGGFYCEELANIAGSFELKVTESNILKVRVKSSTKQKAIEKLRQMEFEEIERRYGLYMVDSTIDIEG